MTSLSYIKGWLEGRFLSQAGAKPLDDVDEEILASFGDYFQEIIDLAIEASGPSQNKAQALVNLKDKVLGIVR